MKQTDVVLADPINWDPKHPPFQLTREGDLFYGRGTTGNAFDIYIHVSHQFKSGTI